MLTFTALNFDAKQKRLILERINFSVTDPITGRRERYRYRVTDNDTGMTADCLTLYGVLGEIHAKGARLHNERSRGLVIP